MHLLASKPGGFSDDEGIVDLEQTPADIAILAAADSTLSALVAAVDAQTASAPSVRLANWLQLLKPAAYDLYQSKVLDHCKLVVVSLLGGASYWQYGYERLAAWAQERHDRYLIVVPGDDAPDPELFKVSTVPVEAVERVWRYLREGGVGNSEQLLNYLAARFIGQDSIIDQDIIDQGSIHKGNQENRHWIEPQTIPPALIYCPGFLEKRSLEKRPVDEVPVDEVPGDEALIDDSSSGALQSWRRRWHLQGDRSLVLLLFYRSHLQSANTAMFDQLIQQLEAAELNVLPIALRSLKDDYSLDLINTLLQQLPVTMIVNTTGFASNRVGNRDLSSEPTSIDSPFSRALPIFQLILSSSTEEDWCSYSQGLRSRDIAMQIVLPEMDGRIITRAVSFKEQSEYSERSQTSIVRYALQQERAAFVAELVWRYAQLATKPNQLKRIALILANYPTKDGRIGNGVGLDTPASTINILIALQKAGYPMADIPESGTELVEALQAFVTNNLDTVNYLPCHQSLSIEHYRDAFYQLPDECQQAVLSRWGAPEEDVKYRAGRIMISGIRFGETFVGIQPARGYNIDQVANYHDPDLVPPHSYLAFYFWLRYVYAVDAVIHVGKHGNLEWLPGKGSALSPQCWPDIALGPMPHLYPFIVNDPGEGAQAKRRTQAVIIDHLMPPMTRAETYGELAELEALVDEYYQASGMDQRRETWLREKILEQLRSSNLIEELMLVCNRGESQKKDSLQREAQQAEFRSSESQSVERSDPDLDVDDTLLAELDAYLCDIKEAQIRHGLHILGQLPEKMKLVDTLVALLRLPRGDSATAQGLLNNMALDFSLCHNGEIFDPLRAEAEAWSGEKPPLLLQISSAAWRTALDTRERLELLAARWVEAYILDEKPLESINEIYPRTAAQLAYAKQFIATALQQSVDNEMDAIISGLAGQFIPPGPSGAPTRGRLDTLPTGRNFFSVDNRSIPTPAAWALGRRSAEALIERHLQEHGDYPEQLGISVWGTATMRTGGDDLAQAFALMGVKPVWAEGSQRAIDIEIIPAMLLGRPRVDVTLRVSGFFRDAFPNVMQLFNRAVAALAAYEEPGSDNRIRTHIRSREAELVESGMPQQEARRQSRYRLFGSKPGAYGAGLQGLIDERCWEERSDLAEAYLNWGGYAYGATVDPTTDKVRGGLKNSFGVDDLMADGADDCEDDGVEARSAFQYQLSQLDAVVQNQDNREHDLLDSDDYYQFQGGMSNAVTVYRGSAPTVYHGDHANPAAPKMRTLKEELNRVIRSRVLNPKWITAMREHGYKGAFEMAASVDYLFAYDATTHMIDDYQYERVADALIFDEENRTFLEAHNSAALEEMAERLLEATQRGLWQVPGAYAEALRDLLLDMDEAREGSQCGVISEG